MTKRIQKAIALVAVLMLLPLAALHAQKKDRITLLLETVGMMSAQGIYLTYVAIGATADGYAKKAYDDSTAVSLLGEYVRVSEVAVKQLKTLLAQKAVEGEDIHFVNELNATYDLLIKEATAYKEFILKKDDRLVKQYDKYRQEAWSKISALLGLEEE